MAKHRWEIECIERSYDLEVKILSRLLNCGFTIDDKDTNDYYLSNSKNTNEEFHLFMGDRDYVGLNGSLTLDRMVEIYNIIEDEILLDKSK